jgi:hypothetical protein
MARHHGPVSSLPVRRRSKTAAQKFRVTVRDACLLAHPQVSFARLLAEPPTMTAR